jgi:hypothetical protein
MAIEETINGGGAVTMATRIRLALGEYDRMKICAIRANLSLSEWLGDAAREKLEREEQTT